MKTRTSRVAHVGAGFVAGYGAAYAVSYAAQAVLTRRARKRLAEKVKERDARRQRAGGQRTRQSDGAVVMTPFGPIHTASSGNMLGMILDELSRAVPEHARNRSTPGDPFNIFGDEESDDARSGGQDGDTEIEQDDKKDDKKSFDADGAPALAVDVLPSLDGQAPADR